jgi:hypothetical protein
METKIEGKRVEKLASTFGFAGGFAVDSVGLSGGIGIFWSSSVTVDLKSFNAHHIDVMVQDKNGSIPPWRFTGIYGEPRRENRHNTWTLMRRLHALRNSPWLCCGDFNETLHATEHFSEHPRDEWQMRNFREAVEDCEHQDLGFSGLHYTWDNRKEGTVNVKARIDRSLGNAALLQQFQVVKVKHVSTIQSDHCLVVTELRNQGNIRPSGGCTFRYENVWQTHGDYDRVVRQLWEGASKGDGLGGFANTLKCMQTGLNAWGTATFGNFKKKLDNQRKELERIRRQSVGRGPSPEEKKLMEKINDTLYQEEIWIK